MIYTMKVQEERKEVFKEAYREGFKEGIKVGILITAKRMLEDGLPVDRVARIAKIPEEQVLTIKAQIPSLKA